MGFEEGLRKQLHGWCNESKALSAKEVCELQRDFCNAHLSAIEGLLDATKIEREQVSLISVHGQTVFHDPPLSWQMIHAPSIANKFNCDVVYDLRGADIAAGGQGAPITPLADRILFQNYMDGKDMIIVNLGGFCNITYLPFSARDSGSGRDVCAVNQILDAYAKHLFQKPYDENGDLAARGTRGTNCDTYEKMIRAQLEGQNKCGKRGSLGTSHSGEYGENLNTILASAAQSTSLDLEKANLLMAACSAIAKTIWTAIWETCAENRRFTVVLAGGGAKNKTLVRFLKEATGRTGLAPRVLTSEELCGLGVCDRESVAMAVLGALCRCGKPITASSATGVAVPPVGGALFPKPYPERGV